MPIIVLTKSHYPATITKEMRHKVYAEALAGIVDAVYEDERRGTQTAPTVCRAQLDGIFEALLATLTASGPHCGDLAVTYAAKLQDHVATLPQPAAA